MVLVSLMGTAVMLNSFLHHARKGLESFLSLMLIFLIYLLLYSMHAFNLISFHQIQLHKDFRQAVRLFYFTKFSTQNFHVRNKGFQKPAEQLTLVV